MEVEAVVQREGVRPVPLPEPSDALVLEALAIAPDARRVVAPAVVAVSFTGDPAVLVLAARGELQDKVHAARGIRHLSHFPTVEERRVVGEVGFIISRHLRHAPHGSVVDHYVRRVRAFQFVDERVRQHELEHHAAAEVEDRLLLVEIHEVARRVVGIIAVAARRVLESHVGHLGAGRRGGALRERRGSRSRRYVKRAAGGA
mmetsp:Transcript_11511/g.30044  ORF Transcript_11511/g.30044 Transcript_11511/m.30044 type:complete len:202 (+) Transcript_11511:128-733(+)